MLAADASAFVLLPGEQRLYTSPGRIAFTLETRAGYPGAKSQVRFSSPSGMAYLTNKRVRLLPHPALASFLLADSALLPQLVYLPETKTPQLQSFAVPITHIYDARVTSPFFGPNAWAAVVRVVRDGGIPGEHATGLELRLTFKEGGAFNFQTAFTQLREQLHQAREAASDQDRGGEVVLEQLPAYEAQAGGTVPATDMMSDRARNSNAQAQMVLPASESSPQVTTSSSAAAPPAYGESPPGYDESTAA